ncbi:MAG: DUF4886 domain-containing protein [Clostridia bacterium]|nr:DUF4886 domain-containing protein [Clostridia bacterium]
MRILAIGNSFSQDGLAWLYQILADLGEKDIFIRNMYIGGCTLDRHAACVRGNLTDYTREDNADGKWGYTPCQTLFSAFDGTDWDYISLQQQSAASGLPETYGELDFLLSFVKKYANENAKLVWQMTWAYPMHNGGEAFAPYGYDHLKMYRAIVETVKEKIVNNGAFTKIVPSGTAIENLYPRFGERLYRDHLHLSFDFGRYVAALTWAKTLTGKSLQGVRFAPEGVTEEEKKAAIEAAEATALSPFAPTL